MYIITNKKNSDYFIKNLNYDDVKQFIINSLDLSLEWNIENFEPLNKAHLVKFILLHDCRIKEVDYAIPLYISNALKELNIKRDNFVTCYFKNGNIEIINLIEYYYILKENL